MPKNYQRSQRVADVIQVALAEILQKDSKDFRFGLITVTHVTVAPDLSFAKVFVSVLEEEKAKETIAALNNAAKYLRFALAKAVILRITPALKFIYDDSSARGYRINALINDALNKEK